MNIGIIGAGRMGSGLGRIWAERGHKVFLGARTAAKAADAARATGHGAQGGSVAEAAKFGEVILLATPWTSTADAVKAAGPLSSKVLIDCTNPLEPDMSGLAVGHTTSAAEEIARMAPGSRVVKAFNIAFADIYQSGSRLFGSRVPTMFYCGDDEEAKSIVRRLIKECGFEPIDAGPLKSARYLEPLAMLMIQLGYTQKMGTNIALSMIQR
ncbi:MAG: NADPH-dependent F420 reductase [bacterium]